ncbi:ANTAR domain-containing protein, partial [Streptosporangium sp. G11]|uniref:ANTAR domain-containing protein n=1 Tax=Streptosporangium sp. G11 TaxID=3436926 RepID=UPI003EB807E2
SRIVIEQAKGMLAERGQIDVSEAFVLLRAYARNHNQQLSAVARQVINQDAIVAELLHSQQPSPATDPTRN